MLYGFPPDKLSVMITSRPIDEESRCRHLITCKICERNISKKYFHCTKCKRGDFKLCQSSGDNDSYCNDRSHKLQVSYAETVKTVDPSDDEVKRYIDQEMDAELDMANKNLEHPFTANALDSHCAIHILNSDSSRESPPSSCQPQMECFCLLFSI
ncbi:hypothetical protein ABVK25_000367 [Lepraria finkii]|uniref:Uncharacterized protein n=1 Tax=Lepraria finkii TaxID=1340010 RepID=A0ABR4BMR2_9LECA